MKFSLITSLCFATFGVFAAEPAYQILDILTANSPTASRSTTWKPGDGLALEVSGMDWTADGKLAVAIRKGEVWILDGVLKGSPDKVTYKLFASGLHEPLGVMRDGNSLLVSQRTEITRLRDTDGDGVADEYLTAGRGWNVSGAYHGYTYGPRHDGRGNLWVALNLDMGDRSDNKTGWRGWGGIIDAKGEFKPMVAGMRSPCGLGENLAGDMFCVDQQGTWIPSTPIYHLREGVFFLNPEGLPSQKLPGSPLTIDEKVPNKVPYPEAIQAVPQMRPPAVWLPYNKTSRSPASPPRRSAAAPISPCAMRRESSARSTDRCLSQSSLTPRSAACLWKKSAANIRAPRFHLLADWRRGWCDCNSLLMAA